MRGEKLRRMLLKMKELELPVSETLVLSFIRDHPDCEQNDWCLAFKMGPTVSSPIVRRLEIKKLIVAKQANRKGPLRTVYRTYRTSALGLELVDKLEGLD